MHPVLTNAQARVADQWTITQGTSADRLMERAAMRCTERILAQAEAGRPVLVIAGMGNNGGDGLAIARLLHMAGRSVRVVVIDHRPAGSKGFERNLLRLKEAGCPFVRVLDPTAIAAGPNELVIDALLGTGADRAVEGLLAAVIDRINGFDAEMLSVDVPSGLLETGLEMAAGRVVRASATYAFQVPRVALVRPGSASYVGRLEVLPIGLDPGFISDLAVKEWIIGEEDVRKRLPFRSDQGHKGTFGHAVLMVGGPGGSGAAVLAARSALRSGVGLVTAKVPLSVGALVQTAAPEALVSMDPHAVLTNGPHTERSIQALGIGPGIGTDPATGILLEGVLQTASFPLVVDADAINLLALNRRSFDMLPVGSILTPHPKEFDRLVGTSLQEGDRIDFARAMAEQRKVVIVLKGHPTAICTPDGAVYYNSTGGHGLAKGGSGDVLTGLLTGLRAQGCEAADAALVAVYLHGLAGDLAARRIGARGMTPGDVIDHLPEAFRIVEEVS